MKSAGVLQGRLFKGRVIFVVSAHREENVDSDVSFAKLVALLNAVSETYDLPVIVSMHPRTQKRVDATGAQFHKQVRLLKPLGFKDYNQLQLSPDGHPNSPT
jgi:UDP-N-acetylglucosamine 2-epimerase (non-hydrolysing)